tara:strand:- start:600 stop:1124 length:525 start_codon:yes stop_codon:yes gene_type:complete
MTSSIIRKYIGREEILKRVAAIANQINTDYKNINDVVIVCVLKGAVNFFSDLSLMLDIEAEYDFIGLSSYEGTESSGKIKITTPLPDLTDKNVILIEDIVDTGLSMNYLNQYLTAMTSPKSISVCTFLDKPSRRKVYFRPDYTCFTIDDLFVVGYGLDYNQKYRNLDYVGVYHG